MKELGFRECKKRKGINIFAGSLGLGIRWGPSEKERRN